MKNFYIVTRNKDKNNMGLIASIIETIEEKGGHASAYVYIDPEDDSKPVYLPIPEDTECVISIGGDGTLVRCAQGIGEREIPLIGVNRGHLGYLCELDDTSIFDAIDRLLQDDYEIEERMMLSGKLNDDKEYLHALNDVVITAGDGLNIINLTVYINGQQLYSYNCDGMILATPTGSTAYNLSANGPLVDPKTKVILLNPLNPHTLNSRSVVIDAGDRLMVELGARHEDMAEHATVAFDGAHRMKLKRGDHVTVRRSKRVTKLIRMSKMNFLERISTKLQEN